MAWIQMEPDDGLGAEFSVLGARSSTVMKTTVKLLGGSKQISLPQPAPAHEITHATGGAKISTATAPLGEADLIASVRT